MVTKKPKGLGLGLEALLGPTRFRRRRRAPKAATASRTRCALDQLQAGRYQPRTPHGRGRAARARREHQGAGRDAAGAGAAARASRAARRQRFEIIAGERRFRAARLAGLDAVPVLVRDVSDEAAAAMALIENIQREDLNPLEEARGLKRLTEEFGMTHEAAARAVGRSRSAASNLLRLLHLTRAGAADAAGRRSRDGPRACAAARSTAPSRSSTPTRSSPSELSVREAERLVARAAPRAYADRRRRRARNVRRRATFVRLEQQLSDVLAAPVEIRLRTRRTGPGRRGEIAIAFASLDELNGLLGKLGHEAA